MCVKHSLSPARSLSFVCSECPPPHALQTQTLCNIYDPSNKSGNTVYYLYIYINTKKLCVSGNPKGRALQACSHHAGGGDIPTSLHACPCACDETALKRAQACAARDAPQQSQTNECNRRPTNAIADQRMQSQTNDCAAHARREGGREAGRCHPLKTPTA